MEMEWILFYFLKIKIKGSLLCSVYSQLPVLLFNFGSINVDVISR